MQTFSAKLSRLSLSAAFNTDISAPFTKAQSTSRAHLLSWAICVKDLLNYAALTIYN